MHDYDNNAIISVSCFDDSITIFLTRYLQYCLLHLPCLCDCTLPDYTNSPELSDFNYNGAFTITLDQNTQENFFYINPANYFTIDYGFKDLP